MIYESHVQVFLYDTHINGNRCTLQADSYVECKVSIGLFCMLSA